MRVLPGDPQPDRDRAVLGPACRCGRSTRHTVGTYACADLACSLYLRGKRKPELRQTKESLTEQETIDRMLGNLDNFVEQALREDV